jgi:anti-sigma B factor antagonist
LNGANPGNLVEREDFGDVTVIRLNLPSLWEDQATEDAFARLYTLIEGSGRTQFVLNLSAIQYFASAALGKLVTLHRKLGAAQARLVLCNVTPPVERILQVTRLNDMLLTYDNEREARQSFS